MSRKFKVTAVAILATLTFVTTAFAGIFDVVGAVVGGVLGVQTTATQDQIENFHKSYLEKSAARVLETGSVDTAFNEMVEEQRKIGSTVEVTEPDADHKIANISGGDLPVIVKCLVNKKAQTITISYTRPDGMPTGNVLTKKYELPAGAATAAPAGPSDDGPSPFANLKQTNPPAVAAPSAASVGKTGTAKPGSAEDSRISKDGSMQLVKKVRFVNDGGLIYVEAVFKMLRPVDLIGFDVKIKDKDGATVYSNVVTYGRPLHNLEVGETYKMSEGLPVRMEKGHKAYLGEFGEAVMSNAMAKFYVRTKRGPKQLNLQTGEWE